VPPGKATFPLHHHLNPQDYIVNLPGGPNSAHQLVNSGHEDPVYLAISTMSEIPDTCRDLPRR
jgi:uncharacterized cupin superfamily protein